MFRQVKLPVPVLPATPLVGKLAVATISAAGVTVAVYCAMLLDSLGSLAELPAVAVAVTEPLVGAV